MIDAFTYSDGELSIVLSNEVIDTLRGYAQTYFHQSEACGVLIGSTSVDYEEIYVESITEPLPKDRRGRSFFFLRDKGHQQFVDRVFEESHGTKRLLGNWHTHPERSPSPSSADYKGWNKLIKHNPDFAPLIFIIVGTSEVAIFMKKGKKFVKIPTIANHEKLPSH